MTYQEDCLTSYQQFQEKELVMLGDGKRLEALGKGDAMLELDHDKTGMLKNVFYVPKLTCNLL